MAIGTLALSLAAFPLPAHARGAAVISAPAEGTSQEDPKIARARELAQNGGELYRDGSYDAAIDAFEAAYDLVRDPNLLYNISLAHEKAGRLESAAEALDRYRAFAPAGEREQLKARSAELRERAGSQSVPDAVDENPSSTQPVEEAPDIAEPDEGDAAASDDPTATDAGGDEDQVDEPKALMGPVGWSLASVSVAALGTGLGLGLASVASRDAARTNCEPGTEEPLCLSDAADDLAASKNLALGADIAYGVGAAAAIGTIVWVAVRAKQRKARSATLQLHPHYARGFVGAGVSGRF